MAEREELRLEVDLDADDARRSARNLEEALEDAAKPLDELESKGKAAGDVLVAMAEEVDRELRDTADAAEKLAQALGPELSAKVDTKQVVADLKNMGLTADDVRADVDQLASALKQVDAIDTRNVQDGLGGISKGLGGVRSNADQSRSVLANLAGNAAQDFGELGGVVGSLGVGVGQLAEYAVDGNIALSNLAKVAGPMAALSVALLGVQYVMQGIAKEKAFDKEQVDAYADAIDEVGEGAQGVLNHLQEMGRFDFVADSGFGGFGTAVRDVTGLLENAGITVSELSQVIAGSDEQTQAWVQSLYASGVAMEEANQIVNAVRQAQENYRSAIERSASAQEVFRSSQEDMNFAWGAQNKLINDQSASWDNLINDLRDGVVNTNKGVFAWRELQGILGLTNQEMSDLARQKLDEALADDEAAARDLADSLVDVVGRFQDAASAIEDIRLTRFEGLGDELQNALDMGDVEVDFQSIKENLRDAFDDLRTFVEENGAVDWAAMLRTDVDVAGFNSEVAGLVTQVRDQFQEGIVEAFELGGAPAAQHFVQSFLPQLTQLGMSPAQAYELLGLPADGSVQVLLEPIIDEQARSRAQQILEAIAGVDPGNPLIAALQVALVQDNIDPELVEIAALVAAKEMGIPVSLEGIPPEQLTAAQAVLDNANFVMPVAADLTKAVKDTQTFRDSQKAEQLPITAKAVTDTADKDFDRTKRKVRIADIVANAVTQTAEGALDGLKSDKAKGGARIAPIQAQATGVDVVNVILALAARQRVADIVAALHGAGDAETTLNNVARDRTADIFVQTHNVGSYNPLGAVSGTASPLGAAPGPLAATASTLTTSGTLTVGTGEVHHHYTANVSAGVIGNRFQIDRAIGESLRRQSRFTGRRQMMRAKL